MALKRFVEQKLGKLPHFLLQTILEWALIVLLFIDGFLAFFSNEFAKFFKLKTPCLLCTRIDNIVFKRNSKIYYNDCICEAHKKDISSLAYCHMHQKLSDIKSMCKGCLLSFAAEKESDCDAYKSLVGVLDKDIGCLVEDDQKMQLKSGRRGDLVKAEKSSTSGVVPKCSCCGETLKMKPTSKRMVRSSSLNRSALLQRSAQSPRSWTLAWKNEESRNLELPHIRCRKLKKFVSDNESEIPKDEDGLNGHKQSRKEGIKDSTVPLLREHKDMNGDFSKTPRGSMKFGIPLALSASASPRWATRLQRKLQSEKPELLFESIDANTTNGEDSDSILRQFRLDHKSLEELYTELDEERSASAVAANNAMAMISRLQAEKAAVIMEALQYQRMMEENAEFDQEELQAMKDLVIKKEEETNALEAELEAYREKYGHINEVGTEEDEIDSNEDYQELNSHSFSSMSECGCPSEVDHNGGNELMKEENGGETLDESLLDFKRERSYLFGMLTNLEKKINPPSDDGTQSSHNDSDMVKYEDKYTGYEYKTILTREMSQIRERLNAIEADSGFLKHAAMTLQKGGEGTKLLAEIAHHLRKLRHSVKMPQEDIVA
ncbi:probable myosin-binding protein 5 [Cornus florida]|uniref:probable myosin-binding protein 5 n=1 Tax=Cornus florida TaxID=4283 RepID=UPI002897710D|nr:probable myosin-binding protein 5 [Cornus florida]